MKTKNIFMSVLAAGCLTVACFAEAATVALLPLIDNTKEKDQDHELINNTYVSAAVRSITTTEGCSLVDNDILTDAVDKNLDNGILPSEQALKNISTQAGVDVVIATQLDKLSTNYEYGKDADTVKIDLRGHMVYYNALTGKYKKVRLFDDFTGELDCYARSNFEMERWSNCVRHEVNAALGNKKIKAEKIRFGW